MKARMHINSLPVQAMSVYWSDHNAYLDLTIRELLAACITAGLDSENTATMLEYWANELAEEFRVIGYSDAVNELQGAN